MARFTPAKAARAREACRRQLVEARKGTDEALVASLEQQLARYTVYLQGRSCCRRCGLELEDEEAKRLEYGSTCWRDRLTQDERDERLAELAQAEAAR